MVSCFECALSDSDVGFFFFSVVFFRDCSLVDNSFWSAFPREWACFLTAATQECNCRSKKTCPLSGKCRSEGIVYQATVTKEDNREEEKTYVGITEGTFKTRYHNHTSSFRNPKRKHATELSKYIWNLKESNVQHSIKWKIIKQCKPYSNKTKRCNLCLYEKFIIICHLQLSSLNTRNEIISTCRHRKKYLLCSQ